MNRSLRRAMVGLLLLLAAAAPAAGTELFVTGPDGAAVTLDGEPLGLLPFDDSIEIIAGPHRLEATLRGAHPHARDLEVAEGEVAHVHLRMQAMSRTSAALSSLALAGSGQRQTGRPLLGWALTGVEVVGLLTALTSDLQVQNHRDDYRLALAEYRTALDPGEIERLQAEAQGYFDDMESAADRRALGFKVAAAAVVVSALDAWLRFPSLDADVDLSVAGPLAGRPAAAEAPTAPTTRIAFTIGF